MNKKAVIVLSGGLDSTTCMGIAKAEGYDLYPITFHYGQRHNREVEQAIEVGKFYDVADHRIVDLTFLKDIGGSALTDEKVDVPTEAEEGIPVTYVPARNMIFLSLASAYAEVIGATAVYTGVSAVDFSGYPDCRPEFIQSMEETINLATKAGVTGKNISVETPLISLSKKETIEKGLSLEVPYDLTTSCYNGKEAACGQCDSCVLRLKGFKEAGAVDPITYEI
ncbi:7-cyano-7-deazaguanine synthase QueC [Fictibacillus sp. 5RED26]|jgi:7-cyano-7-deazaguanine synthase|uniref:7-cyano-7-deazaguanine synthase QueC n=1 Tax=Fictibacillus TaxID=1329200 RepID=UPI0018CFBA18|nr:MULTISPECIES: 7-cyano-7-deazaguanine synthase QueC [unclassified Fictibacillus]MBH0157882.1 7-cyano-7-deazaguanine synthase QueC [Fictibacillus sp. 5RED26]MBH0159724.1 7-cyano-7-deazaguanine synthase QueC [Fictibacillus sp. 26RED30]